jgi:hypothetical protein
MSEEKDSGGTEWMQKLWRPAMGWMYMIICLADMIVFPVLWSLLQAVTHTAITQWNPLTLQGAGLFHIAMGAVLGISAFGRTQEKLAGTASNTTSTPTTGGFSNGNTTAPTTGFSSGTPAVGSAPTGGFGATGGGFGATTSPASSSFGGGGFGSTPSATSSSFTPPASWGTTPVATTAGGKKIVPDEPQPAI